MNITDKLADYVHEIVQKLNKLGIRAAADLRNEKIGFKIREHTLKRIPYLLVVGDKEVEQQEVAVRTRTGEDLGKFNVDDFVAKISEEIKNRQ
jgi:Threonyl-tRNA synthetase